MTATASLPTSVEYKALPLAGLGADSMPRVDVYLPGEGETPPKLYRSADTPVGAKDLDVLRARNVTELWVLAGDYGQIHTFFSANLAALLEDESHPPLERLRLLNHVVGDTLREAFAAPDLKQTVSTTQKLAAHVVDVGIRTEIEIRDVAKVAKHDFCTFTHSANVACYATLLARAAGISDTDELRAIAAGGMLHDLGKLEIPHRILSKPGRLTEEELNLMQRHPTRGFQLLRREGRLSAGQLMMVYQHHEWVDGDGYPVGCLREEMHPWARICAVVDVFEALTGKRPYRRANTMQEALTIMDRTSATHFDAELLHCWKSHFAPRAAA